MALQAISGSNLAAGVTEELRAAIERGDFTPGDRLIERRLAEQLGVSHIPIREALARLEDEGLVERLPRRGARVAQLSTADLEEISSIRTLLEKFVVVRVQERWDRTKETHLRNIVDSMVVAAEQGDSRRVFDLDREFHEQLWELADHSLLMDLAGQLRSRISSFLLAANGVLEPDARVAHAKSHLQLIEAIASSDAERAEVAMAEHISTAVHRIEESRDCETTT